MYVWVLRVGDASHQSQALIKVPMLDEQGRAYGTGRRKSASARVWVKLGDGNFTVNGQALVDYFPRMEHRMQCLRPFLVTASCGAFDVWLTVSGGGTSGKGAAAVDGVAACVPVCIISPRGRVAAASLAVVVAAARECVPLRCDAARAHCCAL